MIELWKSVLLHLKQESVTHVANIQKIQFSCVLTVFLSLARRVGSLRHMC